MRMMHREKEMPPVLNSFSQVFQFDPDITAKTISIVKKLLHEGKLTSALIDESYARIVKFKERLGKIQ
jgi:hypothetical protein